MIDADRHRPIAEIEWISLFSPLRLLSFWPFSDKISVRTLRTANPLGPSKMKSDASHADRRFPLLHVPIILIEG